jgi:hypothetical protein
MPDPIFERETRESMKTILAAVQMYGADGQSVPIRMVHHFASLARFDVPENRFGDTLESLVNACLFALGGEELPRVPRPEVPAYRSDLPQWDPWALRCNLEASKRVGLRVRSWEDPQLREWLDYTIKTLEAS